MTKNIVIKCKPLTFYCPSDETALFDWLSKIQCIHKIQGIGKELHLHIQSNNISDDDLISLMGIFKRYKFKNTEQLKVLMNAENAHWFD